MIKLKSLLNELTNRQKEVKRNYLFKHAKNVGSNKIPSFEDVWKHISLGDGVRDTIQWEMDNIPLTTEPIDNEAVYAKILENIKNDQFERYNDIVYNYKHLNGKWCWRVITVPQSVNPRELKQLGIYWAISERAAEAHWGKHLGSNHFKCTYQALIEFKNVDWPGTIFSRMDMSIGDEEQEIRFLKNAPLLVRKVDVYDNIKKNNTTYFINNRRRA